MTDSRPDPRSASLLARWLSEPPGTAPPSELDDDVVEGVLAMRPDLAPEARVSIDDVLDAITEGPLAAPEGGRAAVEGLIGWLQDHPGAEPPQGVEAEVVEAVYALRPDLAPAPRVSIDDVLGELTAGPLAEQDELEGAPVTSNVISLDAGRARSSRRRWAAGATVSLLAAAAALVVVVPMADRAPDAPLAESEAAQAMRERTETAAPAASPPPAVEQAEKKDSGLLRAQEEDEDFGRFATADQPAPRNEPEPSEDESDGLFGDEALDSLSALDLDDATAEPPAKPSSAPAPAVAELDGERVSTSASVETAAAQTGTVSSKSGSAKRKSEVAQSQAYGGVSASGGASAADFESDDLESEELEDSIVTTRGTRSRDARPSRRDRAPSVSIFGGAKESVASAPPEVAMSEDWDAAPPEEEEGAAPTLADGIDEAPSAAEPDESLDGLRARAWSLAPSDDLGAERADYAAAVATSTTGTLELFISDGDARVAQDAAYRVAQLQLGASQYAAALATIARGLGVSADHTVYRAHLLALQGEIHERRGDPEAAMTSYRQAAETLYGK